MKKHLFSVLLCLLTLSSTSAFCQTPATQKNQQDVKTMLCYKWKLTHMEAQGQRIALPAEMGESFMTLKADGILLESSDGVDSQGTWSFAPQTQIITTIDKDGKEEHKVLKVSSQQLILKSRFEGMDMNLVLKRVD